MRIFNRASADNHEGVRSLLSPYIDNQATAEERRRVEAHLATCEDCRRELSQLRSVVTGLRALPPVPVPRSFAVRQSDVRARGASAWADVILLRRAAATLAACMVLLFGLGVILPRANMSAPAAPAFTRQAPASDSASAPAREQAPTLAAGAQEDQARSTTKSAPPAASGAAPGTGAPTAPAAAAAPAPAAGAAQAPMAATAAPAAAPAPQGLASAPAATVAPTPQGTPQRSAEKATLSADATAAPTSTPTPAAVAVAPSDRATTATADDRDEPNRALWVAQVVLAISLLLALVGGFLGTAGRRRP